MKNIARLLSVLIIIIISYLFYSYHNFKNDILIDAKKIIDIKPWNTVKDLANKLDINYYFLKHYIKNNKENFKLLVWRFEIKKESNIENIISSLENPMAERQINLTILEWWNIYDIDEYLYKKGLIKKWEYTKYVNSNSKIEALTKFYKFLDKDFISLEWYLYPDTYSLKYPLKINELVIKQLDTFEKKVYEKILSEKKLTNDEIYDLINLASIVEKEEKNNSQKRIVAGILKKRLNSGWKIWADITVCYAHKLTSQKCKMVVSKYINEKSQYNTRTMLWLPKTPISNPNNITIDSTLNHQETKYWFYLHNVKTWKIYYGKNNAEHEANKKYMY